MQTLKGKQSINFLITLWVLYLICLMLFWILHDVIFIFLAFSGGIKWEHKSEMGEHCFYVNIVRTGCKQMCFIDNFGVL